MRKFGLIGRSLEHSWSKAYFQEKFSKEKIRGCIYENFSVSELNDIRDLIRQEKNLEGLNITTPYKIAIMDYLDELDPVSEATGAVNCLKISRPDKSIRLKGYNTDMAAFRETIKPMLKDTDNRALVLGTGGAALAVCQALKQLHIDYSIVSRQSKPGLFTYPDLNQNIFHEHQIIINTTPAGMFPGTDQYPPLPYAYLTDNHLLYDLIYNPEETLFLKNGQDAGARVKNGLEMLKVQAELSWEIWCK